MTGLRNGLNSDLMQASALLNITRAAGDRATREGNDRRLLLLLATRLAHRAMGRLPQAACRIGAATAFQMYAVPTTVPEDWQLLELIGLARSRCLLQRCYKLRPGEFASLAEEYPVVSALGDADAIFDLSRRLSASRAQTAQHLRLQSLIKQDLNAAQLRATVGTGSSVDPAVDLDEQIRELFESRRFLRIRFRFASEMAGMTEASAPSSSSRDLVAKACLLCGDPQAARDIWQQISGADEDANVSVSIGMTYLVELDHSARSGISSTPSTRILRISKPIVRLRSVIWSSETRHLPSTSVISRSTFRRFQRACSSSAKGCGSLRINMSATQTRSVGRLPASRPSTVRTDPGAAIKLKPADRRIQSSCDRFRSRPSRHSVGVGANSPQPIRNARRFDPQHGKQFTHMVRGAWFAVNHKQPLAAGLWSEQRNCF